MTWLLQLTCETHLSKQGFAQQSVESMFIHWQQSSGTMEYLMRSQPSPCSKTESVATETVSTWYSRCLLNTHAAASSTLPPPPPSQYKATPREWPTPWHRYWSLQLIYGNLEQFHRLLQLPDVWYTIAFQQAGNNATVGKVFQRSSLCCWGNAVGTRITEISITAVLTNSIPVVIVDHSTITHIGENSTVWKCLIMRYTDISRSSSSSSWKNWFKWHNVIM